MLRRWAVATRDVLLGPRAFFASADPEPALGRSTTHLLIATLLWGFLFGLARSIRTFVVPLVFGGQSVSELPAAFGVGSEAVLALGVGGLVLSTVVVGVLVVPVVWFVLAVLSSLVVSLLGGEDGFARTMAVTGYAAGVFALLGWIPVVGPFANFYVCYVWFVGVAENHGLGSGQAAVATLPVVLTAVAILAVAGPV